MVEEPAEGLTERWAKGKVTVVAFWYGVVIYSPKKLA